MTTLAVTYLVVWLAVVFYVARLATRQRLLRDEVQSLRRRIEAHPNQPGQTSRAA